MGARPMKIYSFLILLSAVVGFSLPQAVSAAENTDPLKKYVTEVGQKHSVARNYIINELGKKLGKKVAEEFLENLKTQPKNPNAIKLLELQTKINKAGTVDPSTKEVVIDFKNVDAITKLGMRCEADLKVIKASALKNKIDIEEFLDTRQKACDLLVQFAKLQQMQADWMAIKANAAQMKNAW